MKSAILHLQKDTCKILLLALLYFLTGKLGISLAVPPGYATIIWPPSGIAVGMLIMHGRRVWPGILIGSFVLNGYISAAYSLETGWNINKSMVAFCIAMGATLQALCGQLLVKQLIGLPVKLNGFKEALRLLFLCGPVSCLIAASIGSGSLYFFNLLEKGALVDHWFTWWMGDIFGVFIFLPIMLLTPGSRSRLIWRGNELGTLPIIAMLAILMALGLTFYAWKITAENAYEKSLAQFEALASESEIALLHRIDSYKTALLGAAGFFQGSETVLREEWRRYVNTLQMQQTFPGINGLGWVEEVKPDQLYNFLLKTREDNAIEFVIHPETYNKPYYIIKFVEPQQDNRQAIGLNIAFEANRLQAANRAKDSGKPAITHPIVLVQDDQKTSGFLLLHPVYWANMPVSGVEDRQNAFRGWIYAAFVAKNLLENLTRSQGHILNIHIYDGDQASEKTLIYSSDTSLNKIKPAFTLSKKIELMEQTWLVVWESTPTYQQHTHTDNSFIILVGGLLFSGMLTLFLMATVLRRMENVEEIIGERNFLLPALIFIIISLAAILLYYTLKQKELSYIKILTDKESAKIELLLNMQTNERLSALKRMSKRWQISGGTSLNLWQSDAYNYIQNLSGLKVMQWVDASYHIRWAEPRKGNENVIGTNILHDAQSVQALKEAAEKDSPTLTPPLNLIQDYPVFIAYLPVYAKGKFDGFIVGIFSIHDFFSSAFTQEIKENYAFSISYEGNEYFKNDLQTDPKNDEWKIDKALQIYDKKWTLHITPTEHFIENQQSKLPLMVLIAGLIIAILSSVTIHYILIARLKSLSLEQSNQKIKAASKDLQASNTLKSAVLASTQYMVVATEKTGIIQVFNPAGEKYLGYTADELIGKQTPALWHDIEEIQQRAKKLSKELNMDVKPSLEVFTQKALLYGVDESEWTFVRKDGSRFPVNVSITPLKDDNQEITGYLGIVEDISKRKEIERLKNEFISTVSHELRTPLTSIRGSLGLILGAMSTGLSENVKKLLMISYSNCERLILLINDILDIDKIASGQMRFDIKPELLVSITRQAIEANEAYAQKFNTSIDLQPFDEHICIAIDSVRYIQVLSNLISNAAKFSPPGKKIDIFITQTDKKVRINVQDYGPGIPTEFCQHIFGKFLQADASDSRSKGGTGLGLHITKEIVNHMQGDIGFNTELGKGTIFWVEFPVITLP